MRLLNIAKIIGVVVLLLVVVVQAYVAIDADALRSIAR